MNEATTAEQIIEAAGAVFAAKGYDGARVDELARAAGVNKATLYYQVGDKSALYHAVLERALGRTADEVCAAMAAVADAPAKIRAFVMVFAAAASDARNIAPLMLREVADGGRNLSPGAIRQMGRILGGLSDAIEEGVAAGYFRAVNSFMVHMMVVGSLLMYAANEPIRHQNVEANPEIYNSDHFISIIAAGEQIADLVLGAIGDNHANQN